MFAFFVEMKKGMVGGRLKSSLMYLERGACSCDTTNLSLLGVALRPLMRGRRVTPLRSEADETAETVIGALLFVCPLNSTCPPDLSIQSRMA